MIVPFLSCRPVLLSLEPSKIAFPGGGCTLIPLKARMRQNLHSAGLSACEHLIRTGLRLPLQSTNICINNYRMNESLDTPIRIGRVWKVINKLSSWPIRLYLIILIAVLAVPAISLIVYSGMAQRHEAVADAKANLLRFVDDMAGRQQAIVAGAGNWRSPFRCSPRYNPGTPLRSLPFFRAFKAEPSIYQYTRL